MRTDWSDKDESQFSESMQTTPVFRVKQFSTKHLHPESHLTPKDHVSMISLPNSDSRKDRTISSSSSLSEKQEIDHFPFCQQQYPAKTQFFGWTRTFDYPIQLTRKALFLFVILLILLAILWWLDASPNNSRPVCCSQPQIPLFSKLQQHHSRHKSSPHSDGDL